MKLINILELPA